MPVNISWDNEEHTILRLHIIGKWTWDDYYPATKEAISMMDTVDHQVGIIAHMESNHIPARAVSQLGPAGAYLRHPRAGQIVLIGTQTYVRILVDMFQRLYAENRQKFLFAGSVEEARTMLAERRPTINKAI